MNIAQHHAARPDGHWAEETGMGRPTACATRKGGGRPTKTKDAWSHLRRNPVFPRLLQRGEGFHATKTSSTVATATCSLSLVRSSDNTASWPASEELQTASVTRTTR